MKKILLLLINLVLVSFIFASNVVSGSSTANTQVNKNIVSGSSIENKLSTSQSSTSSIASSSVTVAPTTTVVTQTIYQPSGYYMYGPTGYGTWGTVIVANPSHSAVIVTPPKPFVSPNQQPIVRPNGVTPSSRPVEPIPSQSIQHPVQSIPAPISRPMPSNFPSAGSFHR